MNEMILKTLEDQLYDKDALLLKYSIQYPEIVASSFYGKKAFNDYNLQKALSLKKYAEETLFKQAKEDYDYATSHSYPFFPYEIIATPTITYNNDSTISLYIDQYTYTGGANGSTYRQSQNWDMIIGCDIPLFSFFPHKPYFLLPILLEINHQIEEQSQYYFDNYCTLVLQTFSPLHYYLENQSIVIFFEQYDIAPHSTGIPTFSIQSDIFKGIATF